MATIAEQLAKHMASQGYPQAAIDQAVAAIKSGKSVTVPSLSGPQSSTKFTPTGSTTSVGTTSRATTTGTTGTTTPAPAVATPTTGTPATSVVIRDGKAVTIPTQVVGGQTIDPVTGQRIPREQIVFTTVGGKTYAGEAKVPTTGVASATSVVIRDGKAVTIPTQVVGGQTIDPVTGQRIPREQIVFTTVGGKTYAGEATIPQESKTLSSVNVYTPLPVPDTYTPPAAFTPTAGRYQTPQDFQSLFEQVKEMQRPALEADIDKALKQLATLGEQRGIWHSGIQAELERKAIQDLQQYYALNALQQAMQLANLSLQEQRDLYDRYARDRDFGRRVFETDRAYELSLWQARAPYELLTEYQRQTLPLEWAQAIGQVPGQVPGTQMEPARSYAENRGARVVWDGTRNVVIINGYEIPAEWGRRDTQGNLLLPKGILDWVLSLPPKGGA